MSTQPQPTERPILFSTAMIQAILAGRKTETRRVIKNAIIEENKYTDNYVNFTFKNGFGNHIPKDNLSDNFFGIVGICPYGQPGDVLFVRETWQQRNEHALKLGFDKYYYKADFKGCTTAGWKPSIHMPKAAARIWLQVTEIKVERLQDITEEAAVNEGVDTHADFIALSEFAKLWKSINGPESWNKNPWVWVVKFKVLSTTGKPQFISEQKNLS